MDSDMNMTNGTQAGMMMMMIPFLHFTGGDHLLFEAWLPTSGGAIGGACVGIFFFAILERVVHALSPVLIQYLVQRKSKIYAKTSKDSTPSPHHDSKSSEMEMSMERVMHLPTRTTLPFMASVDIPRGIIYGFQRLLGFVLMLIVMTFHAGYLISIIAGLTVGEITFGRVSREVYKT